MTKQSQKIDDTSAKSTSSRSNKTARASANVDPVRPREGSKAILLVEMLSRPNGASIADLMSATGWLAHTTRAALTGLRKKGYSVFREPDEAGPSRYRIDAKPQKKGLASGRGSKKLSSRT